MKKILLVLLEIVLVLNLLQFALGILNRLLPEILLIGGLVSLVLLIWKIKRWHDWF